MHRFWDLIVRDVLERLDPKRLVEIGSQGGEGTRKLLDFCEQKDAHLHVVDPEPPANLAALQPRFDRYASFHAALSRDALPTLEAADAYLIDGDHNWYTVITELRLIHASAERAGGPKPLCVLHDVDWPYGQRDLYYDPSNIPEDERQPDRRGGIRPGVAEVLAEGGMNPHLHHAVQEGGPRNGVRTAVEDFVREQGGQYTFLWTPGLSGLGFMYPTERQHESFAQEIQNFCARADQCRGLIELVESERLKLMERLEDAQAKLHDHRKMEAQLAHSQRRAEDNAQRVYELTQRLKNIEDSRSFQIVAAARSLRRRFPL